MRGMVIAGHYRNISISDSLTQLTSGAAGRGTCWTPLAVEPAATVDSTGEFGPNGAILVVGAP